MNEIFNKLSNQISYYRKCAGMPAIKIDSNKTSKL